MEFDHSVRVAQTVTVTFFFFWSFLDFHHSRLSFSGQDTHRETYREKERHSSTEAAFSLLEVGLEPVSCMLQSRCTIQVSCCYSAGLQREAVWQMPMIARSFQFQGTGYDGCPWCLPWGEPEGSRLIQWNYLTSLKIGRERITLCRFLLELKK